MKDMYFKKSEHSLGYPEELFHSLFEQSPFGVQIFSPDGWRLYINKAWQLLFGVTTEMIEGYNILHDKQLLDIGLMPYIKRGFAGETIAVPAINYDVGTQGSGTKNVRWIRAFIYPVLDCGVITEVMLMHEDVTAQVETEIIQQEREKQLRMIIDSLPALIAVMGKDYRYRFCNKTYEEWFGMPVEKIIGKTISEIIGPAGFDRIRGKFQATFKGKVTTYDGYMVYSDGTERYISATMLPNINANKEVEEVFLLVNDRTPYKKAEEKALHHHTELAHLARLSTISELATGLAHELNQPLTTIKLLSGIGLRELENGKNYYKLHDSLEGIGSQAIRAGEIIRQLRSLVANKVPKRAGVNLNKLIIETISFISAETRNANVTVELDLDKDLPEVFANEIQIQQVLINLILNGIDAIKKLEEKKGMVIVTSRHNNLEQAIVTITDTGCGIDKDTLNHIFNSFFSTKGDKGIGIGLSICRSLIERHEGVMYAESTLGKGTALTFTLPFFERLNI